MLGLGGYGSDSDEELQTKRGSASEQAALHSKSTDSPKTFAGVKLKKQQASSTTPSTPSTPKPLRRSPSPPFHNTRSDQDPSTSFREAAENTLEICDVNGQRSGDFGLAEYGFKKPDPSLRCDQDLEAKLARFHALQSKGIYFNASLESNKVFRNPHILTKLVEFVNVDETASNFSLDSTWERPAMLQQGNAKFLAARQKEYTEAREAQQERGKRDRIAFQSSASSSNREPARADRGYKHRARSRSPPRRSRDR